MNDSMQVHHLKLWYAGHATTGPDFSCPFVMRFGS